MERLVQVLDDIDDWTGLVVSAASPGIVIAIALISLSVGLGMFSAGLRGALLGLLLSSIVASVAMTGRKQLR